MLGELHPTRNADLDPAAIAAKSAGRLWWRCRRAAMCGRRPSARARTGTAARAATTQRRRVAGPREVPTDRSLAALHPELASEWDRERNGEPGPGR